jgi:hypothetical protein
MRKSSLFQASLFLLCLLWPAIGKAENRIPLTLQFLKNTEYRLLFSNQTVRLKNGQFKSGGSPEDYLQVKLFKVALGDLNGDGLKDAGAILAVSAGGSGTFYELTAMIHQGNSISQAEPILLGDRIIIHSFMIDSKGMILDIVVHREDDPSCCPTRRLWKRYCLEQKRIKECE